MSEVTIKPLTNKKKSHSLKKGAETLPLNLGEVKMSVDLSTLSLNDLLALQNNIEKQLKEATKGENVEQAKKLLEDAPADLVEDILAVLKGLKKVAGSAGRKSAAKAPKAAKKEFELQGGKVFFGGEEIKATKKDKKGLLRIVKNGKGLPPEVEKQEPAIRDALKKLPVQAAA